MKKVLSSSAALLVLLLAAVAAVPPVDAQCYTCPTRFFWSNAEWGMGATCADAEEDALINAYVWALGACGVNQPCNWGAEEIVTPCMWDGTQWKADGRIQYTCPRDLCM